MTDSCLQAPDPARLPFADLLMQPLSPRLRCLLNENGTIIAQLGPAPHPLGGPGVTPLERRQVGLMTSLANLSRTQVEEDGACVASASANKFANPPETLPQDGTMALRLLPPPAAPFQHVERKPPL